MQESMFFFLQKKYTFWTLFGTILAPFTFGTCCPTINCKNTYNKGFLKNLYRVLFQPSEPLLKNLARKGGDGENCVSRIPRDPSYRSL